MWLELLVPLFLGGQRIGRRRADLPDDFNDDPDLDRGRGFDRDRDRDDGRRDSDVLLALPLQSESTFDVDGERSDFSSCPGCLPFLLSGL